MENQTAFDLNLAVRRWREDLSRSSVFRSENLNELESHLRDSIDRLRSRELSDEEAFLIAARRIGQSRQLESEFGKLNRNSIWLERAMWMLIGVEVWPFFDQLMSGIADHLFQLGWRNVRYDSLAMGNTELVFFSILTQLLAFVVSIFLAWWVLRNCAGKVGQWIARQLPERFSFVLCCAIISSLAFLLFVLVFFIPGWGFAFSGDLNFGPMRISSVIALSEFLIGPLRLVGFVVLTLLLARKQFVPKKA